MRGGIANRSRPNHDPATLQAWSDRLVAGSSLNELAAETGFSRKAIYIALRRKNMPTGKLGKYRSWTKRQLNDAYKLCQQGLTVSQVAERIGVTKHTLENAFHRNGYRLLEMSIKRRTDVKTPARIYSLRREGLTFPEIARRLGMSGDKLSAHRVSACLYRYCAKVGVPAPSADKPPVPKPPKAPRTSSTSTTVTSTRRFCERAALFVSG